MLPDCHNHTSFSMDGSVPAALMCGAADAKGIPVFALTDHCDVNDWEKYDLGRLIPQSVEAVQAEKGKHRCRLLAGVELGQPLEAPEHAEEVLSIPGLDMVVGSIHNLPGQKDFYFTDYLTLSEDEIFLQFKAYYRALYKLAEWNRFDTLAHITYPYRYLNSARRQREILLRCESFDPDADALFELLIQNGRALELNGSSLIRSEEDYALNLRYFARYRELGGELVTFGSDAHTTDTVAQGMAKAVEILKRCGFDRIACFEQRQPFFVVL